jgi:hypothetical protein
MKTIEYIYKNDNSVNVIQLKVSQNSKIGFGIVVQTYHFSIDQVINNDIKQDKNNCLDCPLSYSNDHKLGSCYTHKGFQLMGLKSMLKRLNRIFKDIDTFNQTRFETFLARTNKTEINLVRFGAYGEPILLGENVCEQLSKLSKKVSGYSHQYDKKEFAWSKRFFMASVHNDKDNKSAQNLGFRTFHAIVEKDINTENSVNCPSSKEANIKTSSCISCGLCNGNLTNLKKSIHINLH